MVDITGYISSAIEKVFASNPGRLKMAKTYLSEHSNNIGDVYAHLNDLCGCNFESTAGLQNIVVSSEVTGAVYSAISSAGGTVPPSSICGKVGTLGSFYSCTNVGDIHPTLVATGSELCSLRFQGFQNCTNWAKTAAITTASASVVSDSTKSVYFSSSATGGCFRFVGGMYTIPASINNPSGGGDSVPIPSVKVSYDPASATFSTSAINYQYLADTLTLPSLSVSCTMSGDCNTNVASAVTLKSGWVATTIPSMAVEFSNPSIGSLISLCEYYLDH